MDKIPLVPKKAQSIVKYFRNKIPQSTMDMILSMFTGMNLPGSSSHSGSGRRHQAADHVTLYYKNDMDSDLSIVWKRPVGFLDMPPEVSSFTSDFTLCQNIFKAKNFQNDFPAPNQNSDVSPGGKYKAGQTSLHILVRFNRFSPCFFDNCKRQKI